jgi:hypothetical protein
MVEDMANTLQSKKPTVRRSPGQIENAIGGSLDGSISVLSEVLTLLIWFVSEIMRARRMSLMRVLV